ncbi:hypothetical protein AMTR_s00008p00261770 [Amborella trichopoda]|uniref:Uncharacterized protein n=2 Tax=Amborella trichopoda TaxID=13333 RepID=W1NI48_AMBTC|nr:hypothetical protein AMTR_s00008p00261770 [Amborella trichopoda]
MAELRPANTTRLVASLNFAVFKADILNSTEEAYALAVEVEGDHDMKDSERGNSSRVLFSDSRVPVREENLDEQPSNPLSSQDFLVHFGAKLIPVTTW